MLLITPTGDRHRQFAWLAKQMTPLLGDHLWLVIDDGVEPTPVPQGTYYLRRDRKEGEAEHTLPHQLQFAMSHIQMLEWDKALFIEDDDYYDLDKYVSLMSSLLDSCELAGVANCRYYKVSTSQYAYIDNRMHTALAATGIRRSGLWRLKDEVDHRVRVRNPYVDSGLWSTKELDRVSLLTDHNYHVGFKNFPFGRPSNTEGHRDNNHRWRDDPDHKILRKWLGDQVLPWTQHMGIQLLEPKVKINVPDSNWTRLSNG